MPNHPKLFRFYRKCETCDDWTESNRKDRRFCDRCLKDRANALTRQKRADLRANSSAPKKHEARRCACGRDFVSRAHNQALCDACRPSPKNSVCLDCGAPRPYRRKKFCEPCAASRTKAQDRDAKARMARDAGVRLIGSNQPCKDCGSSFVLSAGSQIRCHPCRETYVARWQKERRRTSAQAAITDRIRRGINGGLGAGVKRRRKWESLVGYNTAELMAHLERQFVKGMSWENRHLWHVDHVTPLRLFSYTTAECPDFKRAWALANLRPLWKRHNLIKQGRRTHLL